jgi:uncharacterized protein (TIGR03086 family)
VTEPNRLDLLERGLDQLATTIGRIAPEQRGLPTPCAGWDVTTLVTHATGGLDNLAAMARGDKPDWSAPSPPLGDDWEGTFRSKATALLDTWRTADPARHGHLDMQIAEAAVHAWDVAAATGQPVAELDPGVAIYALNWSRGTLKPEWRGEGGSGAFGAEVAVAEDAPVYDRLAGWFGRDPGPWRLAADPA